MSFYRNEDILIHKNKIKNTVIKLCALLCICIAISVALCWLVNKNNSYLIQIANTCLSTACIFTIIYKLDTVIVSEYKKIKHYKLIASAPKTKCCGKVTKIGAIITVSSGLKVKEICILSDKKTYSFYLLADFECNFNVEDNVDLTIAKKHIIDSLVI